MVKGKNLYEVCSYCGADLEEDSPVCKKCGAKKPDSGNG